MRRQILVLAAVSAFLWPACTYAAIKYKVIDLGALEGGFSEVHSINNTGQIAGGATKSDGILHATLFDSTGGDDNIDLGTLGSVGSIAEAINDSGQIVGDAGNAEDYIRAAFFDATGAGNNIDLGTLGGRHSTALSINNSGQIVGWAEDSNGNWPQYGYYATLFDSTGDGNNINLGTLGGHESMAMAVNNTDQIIGWSQNAQGLERATLFDPTGDGNNIDLGTLGGRHSTALSINNSGQIVGWSDDKQHSTHATLFDSTGDGNNINLNPSSSFWSEASAINDAGQIVGSSQIDFIFSWRAMLFDPTGDGNNTDLNTLIDPNSGWTLTHAKDINNSGWIVGNGINPQGQQHAFLLVPISSKYSGGTGEPNDPYQIATAEDLMLLGESPEDYDKHFILTADIDLDPNLPGRKVFDRAIIAPDTNYAAWWFQGMSFTGIFDGKGHTISHLTITGEDFLGLFGWVDTEAKVSNLSLEAVDINGSGNNIGGLAGVNYSSISSCYCTGTISGDEVVGGLVGDNNEGSITASYSTGTVSGSMGVGGLVGGNSSRIVGCYSTSTVVGDSYLGGLAGRNYNRINYSYSNGTVSGNRVVGGFVGYNSSTITDCFSTGLVEGDENVGGLVGRISGGSRTGGGSTEIDCFWDVETSGQTNSAGGTGLTTAEMQDPNTFIAAGWDFVNCPDGPHDVWAQSLEGHGYPVLYWQLPAGFGLPGFSGGTGEPDDPYLISTPANWNSIGHNPRLMGAHFRLMNDIDLADVESFVIASEHYPFTGTFDGNGHAVSNFIYGPAQHNCVGLFGYVFGRNACIEALGVVDPKINIDWGYGVGSLVGCLGDGTISGCFARGGGISGGGTHVGGLVGRSYSTISDCYTDGVNVSGRAYVGGLVGIAYSPGTVTDCYSSSVVSGEIFLGGLVAHDPSEYVVASFWDIENSGQKESDGGTGKTTTELQTVATFLDAGWDFVDEIANGTEDIWWIDEGNDYPRLWWEEIEQ